MWGITRFWEKVFILAEGGSGYCSKKKDDICYEVKFSPFLFPLQLFYIVLNVYVKSLINVFRFASGVAFLVFLAFLFPVSVFYFLCFQIQKNVQSIRWLYSHIILVVLARIEKKKLDLI